MEGNSNEKQILKRVSNQSIPSIKNQSETKDVMMKFEIEDPKAKNESNSRNSIKSKLKEIPLQRKYTLPIENQVSSNFAKHENLAKLKFLESLSSNNMKKKSTITEVNYNQSSVAFNIESDINDDKINANDAIKSKGIAVEISNNNDCENKNKFETKASMMPKENSFNYKKLNQVQNDFNNPDEISKWEKACNLVKEKSIQLYENENVRTCLNPFRNDPDPTARYCYYCMTASCCFIWFMLFYMANSA